MGDVFLLGAGFSKAVSDDMPLLQELSSQIRGRLSDLPESLSTLGDNIEIWLSYLSQPHPWLRESENLRNRALALEITEEIEKVLDEKEQLVVQDECPSWLLTLTQHWHKNQAGVISLNYDTLVERAAGKISTGQGQDSHPRAGHLYPVKPTLYPVKLTLSTRRDAAVLSEGAVDSFTLFKLHGSTNWYYSGASESTGEVIYYSAIKGWGDDPSAERNSKQAVSDKTPLIVPPTTEKVGFFQHESLKRIWTQALSSLREATRLFIIGYSLPMTDLAVRLFLHDGARGCGKELHIVNRDSSVIDHYTELLGNAFDIKDEFVGDEAIERFVKKVEDL